MRLPVRVWLVLLVQLGWVDAAEIYRDPPVPRKLTSNAVNGYVSDLAENTLTRSSAYAEAPTTETLLSSSELKRGFPVRYTNGNGNVPRNTKCVLPFMTSGGKVHTDCVGADENPVKPGVGHGWCSVDENFAGRWGGCMPRNYTPSYLTGRDAATPAHLHVEPYRSRVMGESYYATSQDQAHFLAMCIVDVTPRCSQTVGGETVTIVGMGFVAVNMSATFQIGNVRKATSVTMISSRELHTTVPAFQELNGTTEGHLDLKVDGKPLRMCGDAGTFDDSRHMPGFSIQAAPFMLYATDLKNNKVYEINAYNGTYEDLDKYGASGIKRPYGIEVGPDGALYVASAGTDQIFRYELPSGIARGPWATVRGEPRGLRWRGNMLYVVSYYQNRVLRYKHHNSTWNPRAHQYGRQASSNGVPFTQDMTKLMLRPGSARVDHPHELLFHSLDGHLKLFVTSAVNGLVLQFNGLTGAYESVFTKTRVNMASAMAFGNMPKNSDLYVTSPYAGTAWVRFDGATGEMKSRSSDPNMLSPRAMVILGDTMYVAERNVLRIYDIDIGSVIENIISIPAASLSGVALNLKCGADDSQSTKYKDSPFKAHPMSKDHESASNLNHVDGVFLPQHDAMVHQ